MLLVLRTLISRVGSTVAGIAVTTVVAEFFTRILNANDEQTAASTGRQVFLSVVYAKYGRSGIKSLWNEGLASADEYAMFYVLEQASLFPPLSETAIEKIEVEGAALFSPPSFFGTSAAVKDLSTDATILARMMAYLSTSLAR